MRGAFGLRLEPGAPVTFSADGPAIEIDGTPMLATSGAGLGFDNGVFALVFGGDGSLKDICDNGTCLAALEGGADAQEIVVGLSDDAGVNERLLGIDSADRGLSFFAGRLAGGSANLATGPLPTGQRRTVRSSHGKYVTSR